MIQEIAVGAIVAVAALYVGAKYLPAGWRRRIVFVLSRSEGESTLARWLGTESSCGTGCASCKACAPPMSDTSPAGAAGAGAHRVIKLHPKR